MLAAHVATTRCSQVPHNSDYGFHFMPIARILITFPTKYRVGAFPLLIVLALGVLNYLVVFQQFTFGMRFALNEALFIEPAALDYLMVQALPTALLYAFAAHQIRVRLCWPVINVWSIVHAVAFACTLTASLLYILARPEQSMAALGSFVRAPGAQNAFTSFILGLNAHLPAVRAAYNDNTSSGFAPAMLFSTYALLAQTTVMLLLATAASGKYGLHELLVVVRQNEHGEFDVIFEEEQHRKLRDALRAGAVSTRPLPHAPL